VSPSLEKLLYRTDGQSEGGRITRPSKPCLLSGRAARTFDALIILWLFVVSVSTVNAFTGIETPAHRLRIVFFSVFNRGAQVTPNVLEEAGNTLSGCMLDGSRGLVSEKCCLRTTLREAAEPLYMLARNNSRLVPTDQPPVSDNQKVQLYPSARDCC